MADSRFITFPCDHKSWPNVRAILTVGKASRTTESWIATFQRAHDVLHTDLGEAMAGTGAKSKTRNVFSGLRVFLDLKTTLEESYVYIDHVFPRIIDLALEIESLKPKNGLEILRQRREEVHVISKRLAASIVSCAFLCLFPGRCPSHIAGIQQSSRLSVFSFDDFFLHLDSDFQCEKLRYILRYFSTISELHSVPLGNLAFSRKVLQVDDVPKPEDWMCSAQPLCPVVVHTSGLSWSSDSSAESVQVVFGSRHYGGSALSSGRTQEDVWFCERAELMSGMLFNECLSDNEVFYVSGIHLASGPPVHSKLGSLRGSVVPSAPDSVAVYASSNDPTQVTAQHEASICLIDSSAEEICHPYRQRTIISFLSRMLTGLCSKSAGFTIRPVDNLALASGNSDDVLGGTESSSALEEDVAEETSETDLPLSSESLSSSVSDPRLLCFKSSPAFAHETGTRPLLHRARPARNASSWRSNSSTDSSASFPDSMSRAMSLEVESCPTPDDAPPIAAFARRRSGQSSRRGSMLQGQSSFASETGDLPSGFSGCSRRRSSGMSDLSRRSSSSSGSSAGKRSSTDYSSEMEEYCENFQRSIIKTSVIEEESGAMSLMEEDVTGAAAAGAFGATASELTSAGTTRSRMLQKFSVDHPKDVAKPKPIKVGVPLSSGASTGSAPFSVNLTSVPCNPTALDHFVDNLINEVAQDSKLEIEELVREQRVNQLLAKEESAPASSPDSAQGSAPFGLAQNFGVKTTERKKPAETSKELEEAKLRKTQVSIFSTTGEKTMPLAHCHSCERAKEELDDFVTDFLNSVFREAVDVYCHHFGSSDGSRRQSHVEEIWIAPTSHRHSAPSLSDQKTFQKTQSELPGTVGRVRRPLEQCSSQSYDEDIHRLHPPSTSPRTSSLLSEFGMQAGDMTFFGTGKSNSQSHHSSVHGSQSVCHPWNVSSSREYLLGLFSTSTGLYVEKPPTSMDWYVQDLLMDAFDDALVELFGKTSLQNLLRALQPSLQSTQPCEAMEEQLSAGLLRFADDMARKIVIVSEREAAQHTAVAGSASCRSDAQAGTHSGMCFSRWPQALDRKTPFGLEEIASEFANQLIDEAVHIVTGGEPLQRMKRSVIAEHSADGAFGQEPELLALVQWICASASLASEFHYNTTGNTQISQMDVICQIILSRELTVGSLLSEILAWCRKKREQPNDFESLFDFLLTRLT